MRAALWRRLLAEFLGTALLVAAVVGSGAMAAARSPGDSGLQLLENSVATAFALGALILTFGPISGGHFNPVVSAADWFLGRHGRSRRGPASGRGVADRAGGTAVADRAGRAGRAGDVGCADGVGGADRAGGTAVADRAGRAGDVGCADGVGGADRAGGAGGVGVADRADGAGGTGGDGVAGRVGGLSGADLAGYAAAQTAGAIAGAVLANLMFGLAPVTFSGTERAAGHLWLAEVVATAGLLLLIFALARSGRAAAAPAAVGAYIGAAYWFTSSTSFANPAVTVGRAFTDTFAGIAPDSVPGFLLAQIVGLLVGVGLLLALYPSVGRAADRVVVEHPSSPPVEEEIEETTS